MRVLLIIFVTVLSANVILCAIDIDNLGQYPTPYIPTLTNEICTRRPDIKHLRLWSSGIEVIADGALHSCRDVENIWMEQNHIKRLKSETFFNKDKLEEINLRNNGLEYIDEDVFHDLPKLESLVLNCNKLFHFNAEHVKNVPALTTIFLDGNQLLDINTEGIIRNAPMFSVITLNSTLIQCSRLIEIARTLDSAKMRLNGVGYCQSKYLHTDLTLSKVYLSRFAAFFGTSNYQSYLCIPDDRYNAVASAAIANYEKLKLKYVT